MGARTNTLAAERAGVSIKTVVRVVIMAVGVLSVRLAVSADARDVDRRAAAVEARMTDTERLQLVHGLMVIPVPGKAAPPAGEPFTAGYIQGISRLGIPDILESDASLGVTNPLQLRAGDSATAMPSGLAQASSFDSELVYRGGAMIGKEAAAHGINVLLAGGVNLARDPRNGRNFEYFGEDPFLPRTSPSATSMACSNRASARRSSITLATTRSSYATIRTRSSMRARGV